MKNSELIRLSFKNIINNKKQVLKMIVGYIISNVILVVFLYLFFAFYYNTNNVLENNDVALTYATYSEEKIDISELQKGKIKETISYEEIYLFSISIGGFGMARSYYYPKIVIDTNEYNIDKTNRNSFVITTSESYYLEDEYNNVENMIIGNKPSNNNEVMISSKLMNDLNLSLDDVLNKKITLNIPYQNEGNVYYFDEMVDCYVSGVFNSELYNLPSRNLTDEADLWVYDTTFNTIYNDVDNNGRSYVHCYWNICQYYNFKDCKNDYERIHNYVDVNRTFSVVTNDLIIEYVDQYPIIYCIMVILFIIGVVVLYISLMNIYIINDYSYNNRKKYSGLLNAIGMTNKDIKKVYILEIFNTLLISLGIILIFASMASLFINNWIYHIIETGDIELLKSFRFGPKYLLISYSFVGLVMILSTIIISTMMFITNKNKSIVEVLSE